MATPTISIVFPTFNRRKSTHFAFSEIVNTHRYSYEVVVPDNSDAHIGLVSELIRHAEIASFPARLLKLNQNIQSIGASRNLFIGINMCQAEWILMTNTHSILHSTTVQELVDLLAQREFDKTNLGFVEFNGHPEFKRLGGAVRVDKLPAGLPAAEYAFNRGSSMAGVFFRKARIDHSLYPLDSGIYPHVPMLTQLAYDSGAYVVFPSIPVFNGELAYAHGSNEYCTRPACLGLCELIGHAHEFAQRNKLYNSALNRDYLSLIRRKRAFILTTLNAYFAAGQSAKAHEMMESLRTCSKKLSDHGWDEVIEEIIVAR